MGIWFTSVISIALLLCTGSCAGKQEQLDARITCSIDKAVGSPAIISANELKAAAKELTSRVSQYTALHARVILAKKVFCQRKMSVATKYLALHVYHETQAILKVLTSQQFGVHVWENPLTGDLGSVKILDQREESGKHCSLLTFPAILKRIDPNSISVGIQEFCQTDGSTDWMPGTLLEKLQVPSNQMDEDIEQQLIPGHTS